MSMNSIANNGIRPGLSPWIASACALFSLCWQSIAAGDDLEEFLKDRTVRVIARGVDPNTSASGFLWKRQDWVVTNLHAVPSDKGIKVQCRNLTATATVRSVFPEADLALLQVNPRSDGTPALHKCTPYQSAHLKEPGMGAPLTTYGWLGDARQSMPRFMKKSTKGTLRNLLPRNETVVNDLDKYGIPDVNHTEFYLLQGGSLPGYSGASIIDEQNRLVAIVDGGLNQGLNTVKWAIPASKLQALEDGGPWRPQYGEKPPWLWSSGIADPDQFSVLSYTEVDSYTPSSGEETTFDYEWHRTKRLPLSQLARTAVDRYGILSLIDTYGAAAGGQINAASVQRSAEEMYNVAVASGVDPAFDVYEDLNNGLIIAVPAGQGLEFKEVENNPDYYWLESESKLDSGGHIQYKMTQFPVTSAVDLATLSPGDPRYLTEKISELLADCNTPGDSTCIVDSNTLRIVRFDNGDEILKVGFYVQWKNGSRSYDYYSFAVRGDIAFRSFGRFSWYGDAAGLISCAIHQRGPACANPALALVQLSQLIGVHLTTFSRLGIPGSTGSLETRFDYDPKGNEPDTYGIGFFENGELRFHNRRGKLWQESTPGRTNEYREYDRDESKVWLSYGGDRTIIPIAGGEYFRSDDDGQTWTSAGILLREQTN
jgi:hypothetical protein